VATDRFFTRKEYIVPVFNISTALLPLIDINMKNYRIVYCALLLVCFSVFTVEDVVYAQKSVDSSVVPDDGSTVFLEQGVSIPENVSRYFVLNEAPYIEEITSLPERALPIIAFCDSVKRREFIELFVWSDGTIVWCHKDRDRPDSDKYRLSKIDKERIESINAEIVRKGKEYFSGKGRYLNFQIGGDFSYCQTNIMLPNFFYQGSLDVSQINRYTEAKETLTEFNKEEIVLLVKTITGYVSRPYSWDGGFLFWYKDLLLGQSLRSFDDIGDEVLSDNEIDAIASYLFDDIDFFLFCRNTLLSLIPSDGQGTEVELKYMSRETTTTPTGIISWIRDVAATIRSAGDRSRNAVTIVTVYREDEKIRYEYHRGTIGEYRDHSEQIQKRQAEKKERVK